MVFRPLSDLPALSLRLAVAVTLFGAHALAQAPSATPATKPAPTPPPVNGPTGDKLIPQPGVTIPEADRAELQAGVVALGKEITVLKNSLRSKPELLALLPDVQIFHKAVDWALRYNEFFNVKQVAVAKKQLEMGLQRASELREGKPSWITATGLVPRGYISKIDGSVQPYGMVVPEDWKPDETTPRRLDFWCHGRGETLSELDFNNQRLTQKGEFTPPGTLVLHLYGRYCCANKFAGETDLFEALENAKTHYKIDPNKLVVRGFSMGGGATWQFGTHFAGQWAVVQPGAGFGETKEFMKLGTAPDKPLPPEWEQTLWGWYDSVDYVANLSNTTTVAYSGAIDGQKQAADIMIRYAGPEGVNIQHIIAPETPHKIKPEMKPEIDAAVEAGVAKREAQPKKVRFTTYSLIYPNMRWVHVTGLQKQWERADVTAEVQGDKLVVSTTNVTSLNFSPEDGLPNATGIKTIEINGQSLPAKQGAKAGLAAWTKDGTHWESVSGSLDLPANGIPPKSPTLCGPIDHAFMSSFVFVKPTGKPLNDKIGAWVTSELDHATGFWRKVFRGETPAKNDRDIEDSDIAKSNLILWGDPSSNSILAKIVSKLPIQWDKDKITFDGKTYDASHVAPVLIFPNPLNPTKYVVINSGPTFREHALLNNADQTAKLPDWAIVDVDTPADGKWPGKVLQAGFFDEQWKAARK